MADNQNQQPTFQFPTRNIIITGERVARMTTATVRVSRLDQRLVQMSMASAPAARDAVSQASDRYNQAFSQFEAALKQIESDLENSNRSNQRRRSGNPSDSSGKRPTLSRDQSSRDAKANGSSQPAGGQNNAKNGNGKPASSGKPHGEQQTKGQRDSCNGPKAGAQKPAENNRAAQTPKAETVPSPAPVLESTPVAAEPVAAPASLQSL